MANIEKDKRIIRNMIRLYCKKKHNSADLCNECESLLDYAFTKLTKCPFKENKPACANCKIHCYNTEMRQKIREVMIFSGPRMLFYHPKDFFAHLKKTHLHK